MLSLFVLIGAIFGSLAAAMAFLNTYEEFSHHGLSRRDLLRRSLGTAAMTLVFFLAAAMLVGWLFDG